MLPRLFLLGFILFWVELGVFLVLLPWSSLWERNYFLFRYPGLGPWLLNHYLRGVISGLGLVDIGLGVWYAAHFPGTLERLLKALRTPTSPRTRESVTRGQTA